MLGGIEDARTKEFEACSAVHGPLQHLDPADLSFDGAGGPGQVECSLYGIDVLAQLGGKARERRGARGGQHIIERLAALPSQKEGQPLCGRDRCSKRGHLVQQPRHERSVGLAPACRLRSSAGGPRGGPTAIATAVLGPRRTSGPRRAQPCAVVRPRPGRWCSRPRSPHPPTRATGGPRCGIPRPTAAPSDRGGHRACCHAAAGARTGCLRPAAIAGPFCGRFRGAERSGGGRRPSTCRRTASSKRARRPACAAGPRGVVAASGPSIAGVTAVGTPAACSAAISVAIRRRRRGERSATAWTASPRLRSRCHRSATWTASGAPCRTPSA